MSDHRERAGDAADRAESAADEAEEAVARIERLEDESSDMDLAAGRMGHGGHEDRIGELETDHRLRLKVATSLRTFWRDAVPAISILLALLAIIIVSSQESYKAADVKANCEAINTLIDDAKEDGMRVTAKKVKC